MKGVILPFRPRLVRVSALLLIAFFWMLSPYSQAATSDDKGRLVALSNWAMIEYSDLFYDGYLGPLSDFGYLYTQFLDSNSYIGIATADGRLDVLIDGVITTIGAAPQVMTMMAASGNGVINLSGAGVNDGTLLSTFSPGYGEATVLGGKVLSISWKIIIDEGTDQQELCDFSIIVNSSDPSTAISLTLTRTSFGGSNLKQWTLMGFSNSGIPGVTLDYEAMRVRFSSDIALSQITGGNDPLTISAGGSLLVR